MGMSSRATDLVQAHILLLLPSTPFPKFTNLALGPHSDPKTMLHVEQAEHFLFVPPIVTF